MHLRRLGHPYGVWVYRPAIRDSSLLAVAYFLHGWPGAPGDAFRDAQLARVMDDYIACGATPVVIAAPDGNSPVQSETAILIFTLDSSLRRPI